MTHASTVNRFLGAFWRPGPRRLFTKFGACLRLINILHHPSDRFLLSLPISVLVNKYLGPVLDVYARS